MEKREDNLHQKPMTRDLAGEWIPSLRQAGYRLEIDGGRIQPFEERILGSGMCDFALDMTFASYQGRRRLAYDCTGYVAVLELDLSQERRVLEIVSKTLQCLDKAGEFFIQRDKILLIPETVFYNRKYRDEKLAYFPRKEGMPLPEAVEGFLDALMPYTTEGGQRYLQRLKDIFHRNNCSLGDMIVVVNELRRGLFQASCTGQEGALEKEVSSDIKKN